MKPKMRDFTWNLKCVLSLRLIISNSNDKLDEWCLRFWIVNIIIKWILSSNRHSYMTKSVYEILQSALFSWHAFISYLINTTKGYTAIFYAKLSKSCNWCVNLPLGNQRVCFPSIGRHSLSFSRNWFPSWRFMQTAHPVSLYLA